MFYNWLLTAVDEVLNIIKYWLWSVCRQVVRYSRYTWYTSCCCCWIAVVVWWLMQHVRRTVRSARTLAPPRAANTTDANLDTSTKSPTELATVSSHRVISGLFCYWWHSFFYREMHYSVCLSVTFRDWISYFLQTSAICCYLCQRSSFTTDHRTMRCKRNRNLLYWQPT